MQRNYFSTLLISAVLLSMTGAVRAQIIVSDDFSDASGSVTNLSGGAGWPNDGNHDWFTEGSAPAPQITVGGLTFSAGGNTLAESGNKLTTPGSDTGAFRNLPSLYGGDANQTLWISFLTSNTSDANTGGYAGLSLINAYTDNSNYVQSENLFIGETDGSDQYGFVDDASGSSNAAAQLTGTAADVSTHLLVTELQFTASGSTEVTLYVDPTPGVAPLGAPSADETYTDSFVFDQVRFQSGSAADASYNFDELRISNTYADVAPLATPEPSGLTAAALGILTAFLAIITRRRLRKNLINVN